MLHYTLQADPLSHQWQIELTFEQPAPIASVLSLANWVPGSYMIRDFARHIVNIEAECNSQPETLMQHNKNTWHTTPKAGKWIIRYTVYANDLSVRGSFLNHERAFFDGACLFLKVEGLSEQTHRVSLRDLPADWQVATTLPAVPASEHEFSAPSYAELIDHPVEIGQLEILTFQANGIDHRIALSGHYADFDRERLLQDVEKICATALQMFPAPAPFSEYLFMLFLGDRVYGGLEHLSSTALMADHRSLPARGIKAADDAYTELLGLFAHEYFHAWNVKSIKPAAFQPYLLDNESHTELLWAFEGITSYYDDLLLARSGVISADAYLKLLANNLTRVQQGNGRLKQTLAQSSFNAWTKYYKQDENSPNAIVSYYQKGALAALCLDLLIRERSQQQHSLDSVMQALYQDWLENGKGLQENEWQRRAEEVTGLNLEDFFQEAIFSTRDLPLNACLKTAGIDLHWLPAARGNGGNVVSEFPAENSVADFGARFKQNGDSITLTHVFNHSSAECASLSAQDRIVALNGFQCSEFDKLWQRFAVGDCVSVHYFRHGYLLQTELSVQAAAADTAYLKVEDKALLNHWLQSK